jgi:SpoVK/Ycf46/Vps4 family AAA+-type ATPase
MDNARDLELLVASHHPIVSIESAEEERVEALLAEVAARLDLPLFIWRATRGLVRTGTPDPIYETDKPATALKSAAAMQTDALYLFHDLQRYFEDPVVLRALRDIAVQFAVARRALVLCAPELPIPVDLRASVAPFTLELPGPEDLKRMAVRTLRDLGAPTKVRIDLPVADLERLIANLRGLTLLEAQRLLMQVALDDLRIDAEDLRRVQELKKEILARDGVLTLHPDEAHLQQVGGLAALKEWLKMRGAAFGPEAATYGLEPPRGLLLIGVQGCGKSLTARAVASEWNVALLQLEAGALFDKYIGESERNLRKALKTAEAMAPCVLWIDEVEKGFAARDSATDGGLARRLLGSLLTWLQERKAPVFTMATANDVGSLPPEFLRKGRFDEIFFLDLPGGAARRAIAAIHLSRRRQDPARFDLGALAAATEGFSGAEIEAVVVSALYAAFAAKASLDDRHLRAAAAATVPLSRTCRESIDALRDWARGRAVAADGSAADPAARPAA